MRCATVVVLAACSHAPAKPAAPAGPTFDVPFAANAPVVDGVIDAAEWAGAATTTVGGLTLRFLHDRTQVYVAVEHPEPMGFTCVLLAKPSGVRVLHASAKLGSALYIATPSGAYDPMFKDYAWRDAAAMQREEHWRATTMKTGAPPAQEFAIDLAALGPLAVSHFHSKPDAQDLAEAKIIVWPAGLDDGAANVQLIAGFNPGGQRFDTQRWITLVPR